MLSSRDSSTSAYSAKVAANSAEVGGYDGRNVGWIGMTSAGIYEIAYPASVPMKSGLRLISERARGGGLELERIIESLSSRESKDRIGCESSKAKASIPTSSGLRQKGFLGFARNDKFYASGRTWLMIV